MLKLIFPFVVLFCVAANSANSQKIAIVNIDEVLTSMPKYEAATVEIDKLSAEWNQEVEQAYDKIKAMYNKYQAERVLLSDNQRRDKEDEIMKAEEEVRELQRKRFGPEGDLFLKRQELVAPIQEKVFEAIAQMSSAKGYDIIFDKNGNAGLLFVTDDYDKTSELKRKLNIK